VVGLALDRLPKLQRDERGGAFVGGVGALPNAGDIGVAGRLHVRLLVRPITILNGHPAGLVDHLGIVGALPKDRQMVGRFNGEKRHDSLLKKPKARRSSRAFGE